MGSGRPEVWGLGEALGDALGPALDGKTHCVSHIFTHMDAHILGTLWKGLQRWEALARSHRGTADGSTVGGRGPGWLWHCAPVSALGSCGMLWSRDGLVHHFTDGETESQREE